MSGTDVQVVAYGLLAAAAWGSGDFNGGFASRGVPTYLVVWVSQLVGGLFLFLLAFNLTPRVPPAPVLVLGGAAGLVGVTALVLFYQGMATGKMGLVAPLTGVVAAGAPVVVGIFIDGVPRPARLVGFGVALVGVWLLAGAGRSAAVHRREIGLALAAGFGFAIFFILIDRVSEADVLWPLVAARAASLVLLAPLAVRHGRMRSLRGIPRWRRVAGAMVLTGLLHTVGDAFFALATRTGRLDVAVVLSSLYPLATILLARALLREQLDRRQQLGAGATILAILLIAT